MAIASNAGVDIYYEVQGAGSPLVLLHGYMSSLALWQVLGYVDALSENHRVIAIDARGHGRSGKPHARTAYALTHRLADILAVLDAVGVTRAHFLGYSMGGWQALGMAVHHPRRVASLVVGGAHPYEESFDAFDDVDGSDPEAFMAALERFLGERIVPQVREAMLHNDLRALVAAATHRTGFDAQLSRIDMPLMLFVGARDQRVAAMKRAASELRRAPPLIVPQATHANTLFFTKSLLPAMQDFLLRQPAL
jgi:pimeloyl-ACP methyl ester carboxylesterase